MPNIEAMKYQTPLRNAGCEMLAIAAIVVIGFTYLGATLEIGSRSLVTGQVTGFGLVETKGYGQVGSIVRAQVRLSENQTVSISLPDRSLCKVGSKIEIEETHTFFGARYRVGLRDCSPS